MSVRFGIAAFVKSPAKRDRLAGVNDSRWMTGRRIYRSAGSAATLCPLEFRGADRTAVGSGVSPSCGIPP